jgi:hypothetical protein
MANQVVLTFAGEEKQLTSSFDRVGAASKQMTDKVAGASKAVDEHGSRLGKMGERADNSERNLIGVHDVIDGTATIMQGPGKAGIVAYVQGWADLTGGLAPLLISMAQLKIRTLAATAAEHAHTAAAKVSRGATLAWAGAQRVLNVAFWTSPIGLIIAAIVVLVAVVVLIATRTRWFQTIWRVAWTGIKAGALAFVNWFRGLPGMISSAIGVVTGIITAPFRAAFNAIARAWNSTVGRLSFSVPSWVPGLGGKGFSMPNLPTYHRGGVVPGVPGQEVLAILQAGETVSPAGSDGRTVLELRSSGSEVDDALVTILARAVRKRGGNVQLVLGTSRG